MPRFGDRGRQERHPIPRPGICLSPGLLAFSLVLIKQRQFTRTAIFPLPQKPPLRQNPVSSFSAMPPASARWEMKAGEPAACAQASASEGPVSPENYNSQHASQLTPLFLARSLALSLNVWAGGAGTGGNSGPLIGGGWGFCPLFTAATSRGRLEL